MTSAVPSNFEQSFVALPVQVSWDIPRGTRGQLSDTASVKIMPPSIPYANMQGADTPTAVWQSYKQAEECLTALLVHEAAERVNNAARKRSFAVQNEKRAGNRSCYDACVQNKTNRKEFIRLSRNDDPIQVGSFHLFTLSVQPRDRYSRDEGSNTPPRKRQKVAPDCQWERGDVVMLSICETTLLEYHTPRDDVANSKRGHRPTQPTNDSELESLGYRSFIGPPNIRHGVVISDRKIFFAVEAGTLLSDVLATMTACDLTVGFGVFQTESSVLDLARHGWALRTMEDSPLSKYVVDPRLSWQCYSSSEREALEGMYAGEIGDDTDPLRQSLTQEQMAIPAVLGSRVATRASFRWGERGGGISGPTRSSRPVMRRWCHLDWPLFLCVQGPPGSGKSTTIVGVVTHCLSLVRYNAVTSTGIGFALRNHPRFLIAAPTNYATDELLVRLTKDQKFIQYVSELSFNARRTNVERAISSFLECCAVIRIGRHSKDLRKEVVETLDDNIAAKAAESVRTSVKSVEEQIRDIDKKIGQVDATAKMVTGVTAKINESRRSGSENTVMVDGVACTLQGDVPGGLVRAHALHVALRTKIEGLTKEKGALEGEKERICSIFRMQDNQADAKYLRTLALCNAVCIFSTCDGAANLVNATEMMPSFRPVGEPPNAFGAFDLVLVDEAARCTIPQLLVPVAVAQHLRRNALEERSKNFDVCAVGDPAQNAATVLSRHPTVQKLLPISFLERALELLSAENAAASTQSKALPWAPSFITLLNRQFRMHPLISEFPRNRFYGGKLKDGLAFSNFHRPWHFQSESARFTRGDEGNIFTTSGGGLGPLLFIATDWPSRRAEHGGAPTTGNRHGGSFKLNKLFQASDFSKFRFPNSRGNIGEALVVVRVLVALRKLLVCDRHDDGARDFDAQRQQAARRKPSVLVIAPYQLQRVLIEELLSIRATGSRRLSLREMFGSCQGATSNFDELMFPKAVAMLSSAPNVSSDAIPVKDSVAFLAEMYSSIPMLQDCFDITVSTVDSSIGREVDIVILSKVAGDSAFLQDDKRMCVALTRASSLLVVCGEVGDIYNVNSEADSWKCFAKHCHGKGLLVSVQEALEYLDNIIAASDQ